MARAFGRGRNRSWMDSWGPRPKSLSAAVAVARKKVEQAPRLIPVCGHRYLPDRPGTAGNPVFSVYQTDIIHYGADLWSYLDNEFSSNCGTPEYQLPGEIRRIEFWSQFVEESG